MDLQVIGNLAVDLLKESKELLGTVSPMQASDHAARFHVEGGEEVYGAMALIVVGVPLTLTWSEREQWLSAIEGLYLGLFVHTQYDSPLRRIEVEADNVADFVNEKWIVGELECFSSVRLESEGVPNPPDRRRAQFLCFSQGTCAPMSGVPWCSLKGSGDDTFDVVVANAAGGTGSRLVEKTVEALLEEPRAPLDDGHPRGVEILSDFAVGSSLMGQENDTGPKRQELGRSATRRPIHKDAAFLRGEIQRRRRRASRHAVLPSLAEGKTGMIKCKGISGAGH